MAWISTTYLVTDNQMNISINTDHIRAVKRRESNGAAIILWSTPNAPALEVSMTYESVLALIARAES